MTFQGRDGPVDIEPVTAQAWVQILAKYRQPNNLRAMFEIGVTLGPFIAIWAMAWWALQYSASAALALAALNGFFLVRLFIIQHDCGHGSYFAGAAQNKWTGRALGVLTMTPYDIWRKSHSIHHSDSGNLDRRGMGDISTLTVSEYYELDWLGRLLYRAYRHPIVLFAIGPAVLFILQQRLPLGYMTSGSKYWLSAMGTNLGILAILTGIYMAGGWLPILLIFLPTVSAAASLGVWLFYVQHQFEETTWDRQEDWQLHHAALHGSSHYVLPPVLQWLTGNIGIHHVHHLYSRIPFYRLTEVLKDHSILAQSQRLTLRESFSCVNMQLWDETQRKLLSFKQAKQLMSQRVSD